jgi:MYXO-CTERM domain-containing protein
VVIDHGTHDTTYGHLRNGSVTVQVGDTVECGAVIGQIGSAGCSTGAHLHFQPRPDGGSYLQSPLDPYQGDCSPTESSLWGEQGPHRGLPGFTCDDVPPMPQCPEGTYEVWTCLDDGSGRRRCLDGVDSTEDCEWECTTMPTGIDDECALPPDGDRDGARVDTDCDDSDPNVHPGAVETCGDQIDQDCSGSDDECAGTGVGGAAASSATAATTGAVGGLGGSSASAGAVDTTTGIAATSSGGAAASSGGAAAASSTAGATGLPGGGSSATPAGGGSGLGDAGRPTPQKVESGCSCRQGPATPHPAGAASLLLLLGLTLNRRRRVSR